MSLTVEKRKGRYLVSYSERQIEASPEHVANLIRLYWPDVVTHLRQKLTLSREPEPPMPVDDRILNR